MLKSYFSMGCLFIFVTSLFCFSQGVLAGHEIIGAPKCKACHKAKTGDQWKIWTESAHARAFETLASEDAGKIAADNGLGDPQQEEACLKCHATRAFLGAGVVVNEKAKYANSEGIGCEACHGPGSDYKPKKVMVDPQAARAAGMVSVREAHACARCHNEDSPTFKGFDFEERWAEIAHPVPTRGAAQTDTSATMTGMPDEIIFTSSVGNVLFPHGAHVKDLEIECAECHHEIHASGLDTPHPDYLTSSWSSCETCHGTDSETGQQYSKCLDCHKSDSDNIANETLSSKVVVHKSCWKCHESGTGVAASAGCKDCHKKNGE